MPITQNVIIEDAELPATLPCMVGAPMPSGSSAGFTPSPVFTPPDIAGNTLWLRADQGITIATGVSVWADQSGLGHNLVQGTGANQPTFNASGPNGLPYVTGNGTSQYLKGVWAQVQPVERFLVLQLPASWSASRYICDGGDLNGLTFYQPSSETQATLYCGSGLGSTLANPSIWQMYDLQANAGSSAIVQSGITVASGNAGNTTSPGGCTLFADASGAIWSAASIAEVIDYNTILTPNQRAQVRFYLQNRYLIP